VFNLKIKSHATLKACTLKTVYLAFSPRSLCLCGENSFAKVLGLQQQRSLSCSNSSSVCPKKKKPENRLLQ
jgi:hypothetical protein